MPKVSSKAKSSESSPGVSLFLLKHDGRRIVVPRPATYKATIQLVMKHFPCFSEDRIVFETTELEICRGEIAEVGQDSWELVIGFLSSINVSESKVDPPPRVQDPAKAILDRWKTSKSFSTLAPTTTMGLIQINLEFLTGKSLFIAINRSQSLLKVFEKLSLGEWKKEFDGCRITNYDETPDSLGMEDGDSVVLFKEQVGGKPVIYINTPITATVTLSLIPQWDFSAIYPIMPIKVLPLGNLNRQEIQWSVQTHVDGTLTELNTGLDVAYLFWEAHTNKHLALPRSPPSSPAFGQTSSVERFDPASSDVFDSESVLLPTEKLTPYLDKSLKSLGLHVEARTSFVTYWLPSFLKHSHIALCFLPQQSYERAAPLTVSPTPDVITRVFMLFKGIEDPDRWPEAVARAETLVNWAKIVGVDAEKAGDRSLYRVLEWGGMEALN